VPDELDAKGWSASREARTGGVHSGHPDMPQIACAAAIRTCRDPIGHADVRTLNGGAAWSGTHSVLQLSPSTGRGDSLPHVNDIPWSEGRWTHDPAHVEVVGDGLVVTARAGSDAWRTTAYGFIHDSEHALLTAHEQDTAFEVSFELDFSNQFDQAGIFLRIEPATWIKAGVELSDGVESLGAVVTRGESDWSLSPVPSWAGHRVTVRASRAGNAVTIRARIDSEPWQLVRVAPLDASAVVHSGPYCCAPSSEGLTVHFTSWRRTGADEVLHPEG
jgi:regulation of enolase protein 1 (concanavalin A-like superfamily)